MSVPDARFAPRFARSRPWSRALGVMVAGLAAAATAAGAQITIYDDVDYRGPSLTISGDVRDLRDTGWNDRVSSLRLRNGVWELCREVNFRDCRTVSSDDRDLRRSGWNDTISSLRLAGGGGGGAPGIVAYQDFNYRGESRSFGRSERDLRSLGWNDRISSLRIGSGVWELCREIDYRDCQTFRSDEPELARMRGWNDAISSLRRVDSDRPVIEVFEHYDYGGASRAFDRSVGELDREGWNDRISSLRVISGRWQICRHNDYRECIEIGGSERELRRDWNDAISSLRPLRPFSDD